MPSRRTLLIAILIVVLVAGAFEGVVAVRHFGLPVVTSSASPSPRTTPSPSASPSPTQLAGPLEARIGVATCPVAHVGDHACLTVTFTNAGPAIVKLAMILDTDQPYTDWFEHHTGATLSGTDPTTGCALDVAHLQIVCGPVPVGGQLVIHLSGFVASVGTYQYGVRFGDIAGGFLADVDLHPDGTPTILSWTEAAT